MIINNQTNINETLPFNSEEDFLLADLLQRTENEQQNLLLRSPGKFFETKKNALFTHDTFY